MGDLFLSNDSKVLKTLILALKSSLEIRDEEIRERDEEIELLKEINRSLRLAKYASSQSERNGNQLEFFNESEILSEIEEKTRALQKITVKSHPRAKPKRKPLPSNLPREERIIELPEGQRHCLCGCEYKEIGEDRSEKLDMIPAQFKVIDIRRKKYACPSCRGSLKRAPLPKEVIPKSNATPGLLASIAVSKYADSLPLYRQEQIYLRLGIDLPRSTMGSWMIKCGRLFTPLINLFWDELLADSYAQMDETRIQVLKEEGKKPTTQSWLWLTARAGPKPIVVFEYDPTRKNTVPNRLLEGFEGYLQCDGYAGYNEICKKPKITRVGCGYHIRRKFFEAGKVSQKKNVKTLAQEVIDIFKVLFEIEEIARNQHLDTDKRYILRQERAKPVLDHLKKWLDEHSKNVLPKGKLGKAISYAKNEWSNFIRYLEDGRLEIGTIFAENKIRPIALGRRNWLFCDTTQGAEGSAAIYSMIETAKANGLNPYKYFKHLFERLPYAENVEDFEALLPWNVNKALC